MSESSAQHSGLFPVPQGASTISEAQEDSISKMWSAYMEEAGEHDKRMADTWKDDAMGFLVFAGLFSTIVAIFLIASLKALFPDAGDRNIFHLFQVSLQLANGTFVLPQAYSSPSPTASIVWVNILWLLSLVFGLISTLSAISLRQWARSYIELPHIPGSSSERARVRSFLFLGTLRYRMRFAVEILPALLHLSMFLFLAGLVIFSFIIHRTVAIVISVSVGLVGLAYLTLTILPCVYRNCPYRTPMSSVFWYLWHAFAFLAALCLQWILKRLHALLVPFNLGEIKSLRQRKLTEWLEGVENTLNDHRRRLRDGFQESTIQVALDASVDMDVEALTWLLKRPALAENSKIQDFVARTPGDMVIQLMSAPVESGSIVFRDRLLTLLRSCAPGTVGLDEEVRRQRLSVCLDAIHRIVKASSAVHGISPSESVLGDVRINFANIGLMRALWVDTDLTIRIISRSICALLARHLLRKYPLEESELAWLQDVMGKPSHTIFNSLDNLARVDAMNLDSYVYDVFSQETDDLPVDHAIFFMETLAILVGAGSQVTLRRDVLEEGISSLMQRAEEQDGRLLEVVWKLCRTYEAVFPTGTDSAAPEPRTSSNPNQQGDEHRTIQLNSRMPMPLSRYI